MEEDKYYHIEQSRIKSLINEIREEASNNISRLRDTDKYVVNKALREIERYGIQLDLLIRIFRL